MATRYTSPDGTRYHIDAHQVEGGTYEPLVTILFRTCVVPVNVGVETFQTYDDAVFEGIVIAECNG